MRAQYDHLESDMEKETLYRYFGGEATDAERAAIRRWVEESPGHYSDFLRERRFFDTASVIAPELSRSTATVPVPRWRRRLRTVAAAAAGAVIAVCVTLTVERATAPAAPSPILAMAVPAGQRMKIDLADGTSVWLNSNTRISFPEAFGAHSRRVSIDGEAYFTVAKDADHPFTVETSYGDVVVRGTEFNVEAYSDANMFNLSLVEGAVDFHRQNRTVSLTPGRVLTVAGDGSLGYADVEPTALEWVHGIVSFRDMPLRDIIGRFEKYYGVKVAFDRPDIADVRFSGKFYLEDGIEHALNTIRHDVRFTYEADRDFRRITIK